MMRRPTQVWNGNLVVKREGIKSRLTASLTRPAVVKRVFHPSYLLELFVFLLSGTLVRLRKSARFSNRFPSSVDLCTLRAGPVSLHHFGVAHQTSLRAWRTMMSNSNSLLSR